MKSTARFSVDPRLSALLGESYTSSERALRELVDNAWDSEARVVKITLPMVISGEPVVIDDDTPTATAKPTLPLTGTILTSACLNLPDNFTR